MCDCDCGCIKIIWYLFLSTKSLKEKEKEKKGDTLPAGRFTQQSEKKKNKVRVNLAKINLYPSLTNSYGFAFCSLFFLIFVNPQYDMIQMIDKEKQVLNFVDSLM